MRCISKRVLPAFLALVFAVVLLSRPAAAVEASPFGVNIHTPQGEEMVFLLDRLQEAGIGWVRIDFLWSWIQPAPDVWDWSVYDALVNAARARGIEIYASIGETPDWATSGVPRFSPPDDPAVWAEFCSRAGSRYRGKIRYWGLWNEPNLPKFWTGSRQQYIDIILKRGADALHAANPSAQVGGPDLAHLTAGDADWYDWLRDVLRQAGDRLDFVTHHVYDDDGPRDITDRLDGSTVFANRPDFWDVVNPSLREVLKNVGWSGPVWITETGWESARVGESTQASHLRGLLDEWFTGRPNRVWIGKVFVYELKDGTTPDSPSWGLLRPDRSAKPAFDAYRGFIVDHQPQAVDDAAPISSTFPDTLESGQTLDVRLTFENTGTTTWTAASGYKLGAVDDVDAFADARQPLAAGDSIAPGQRKTFTVPITAPALPGTYTIRWRMLREGEDRFGAVYQKQVTVNFAPPRPQRALALFGGRFDVEVSWRDPGSGRAGFGRAVPDTNQSGFFWFFGANNLELVVKVLDGRALNQHYWVFYGALSNVEYWITVTDLRTGATKRYHNPAGSFCGRGDTAAFRDGAAASTLQASAETLPELSLPSPEPFPLSREAGGRWERGLGGEAFSPAEACAPDAQTLCLLGSRFRVSVEWQDHQGNTGKGFAVPRSDASGTFWFFGADNTELVVKVLDGRVLNNKFWVFYGALSDVRYTITVRDLQTGVRKRYTNQAGNLCGKADTAAF